MIEEQLVRLRKEYIRSETPDYLSKNGWAELLPKLTVEREAVYVNWFGRGAVFAGFVILLFVSTLGIAQAAKPGDALYPVKLLSDDVYAKITGQYQIKVERRGQEVIDVSGESSKNLDEATKQYQKTLDETRGEVEKSGKTQEFKQVLENQEEKFKKAQENNPSAQNKLEEVIRHTEQVKGEVHGQSDKKPDVSDGNNGIGNGQNNPGQEQKGLQPENKLSH